MLLEILYIIREIKKTSGNYLSFSIISCRRVKRTILRIVKHVFAPLFRRARCGEQTFSLLFLPPLLRPPIVASAAQISSSWGGTPAVISKSFCVGALRGICLPTIIPTSLSDRFRDASPSLFRHLAQKNDMLARVPLAIIAGFRLPKSANDLENRSL